MSRYFHIANGLRGAYLADSSRVIRVDTRRELRRSLESECDAAREAYGFGGSKREIASVAAIIWRESSPRFEGRKSYLPYAIGFGQSRNLKDRPFGVFVNHATREEWEEEQASDY